jgi:hypothetical protein
MPGFFQRQWLAQQFSAGLLYLQVSRVANFGLWEALGLDIMKFLEPEEAD